MRTAYWSEPCPLKRKYPPEFGGGDICRVVGFVFFLATLSVVQGIHSFPGSKWIPLGITALLGLATYLLGFPFANWMDRWRHQRAWFRAFYANNADLGINRKALRATIHALRHSYVVGPTQVATALALGLRQGASEPRTTLVDDACREYLARKA